MRDVFDRLYSRLIANKSTWSTSSEVQFKKSLLDPIISQKHVTLLGCGDFALGFSVKESVSKVDGVDFSKVAIESSKQNPKYDSQKIGLYALDLANETLNLSRSDVIVDDYLSHCIVDNRAKYFSNVRSLMDDTSLYVTLAVAWPEGFEWPSFISSSLDVASRTQMQDGKVVRILKEPKDLLKELSENGFVTEYNEVIINPTGQPIFFSLNRLRR